ncbi:MAG: HEPN domain-containing protein [Candidatus Bathyarchaeia archaeon]
MFGPGAISFEEAEILRERAEAFLRNAERLAKERIQDLAAFNVEQYCRLLLKYKLLVKTGTYPRTHSIIRLLRELSAISPALRPLLEDADNILYLTKIEDAYIGSRYLPRRYEESEVKGMLRFAKGVFKGLVEGI